MRCFGVLALLLASPCLYACELIADFDRGKLDAGQGQGAGGPAVVPDEPEEDAGPSDLDAGQ